MTDRTDARVGARWTTDDVVHARLDLVCAWCGRTCRDGAWSATPQRAELAVTHGICPDCLSRVGRPARATL